ncbi:hypothetical protein KFE80_06075 [bacterium SCSIO 12696]|nr:hypothetical protein KFE80_06075 [bacterium SCSIO 12696]
MKKLLFLSMFLSSIVQAGSSEGVVSSPLVSSGDAFFFSAGAHVNKPSCAVQTLGSWAVDLKTEHGKAVMSIVIAAHAQKKRVHVQGKNNCDVWGDRESIDYVFIVD